ncbi:MAG: hypothetical protein QM762_10280 [Chryseolinea sp.]
MEYLRANSDFLQLLAGIVGFCAYIPLTIGIVNERTRQSFAAFLLWGLIDGVAMVSSILQHGNFWLATSNVAGTFFIAGLLLYKGQFEWSKTETLTSVLVVVCLIVWYLSGNTGAIVASSLAVILAGIPQMLHTMRHPEHTPTAVYMIWLSANTISFFSARAWTIDEVFYASCSLLLCAIILAIAGLKKRRHKASL